MKAIYRVTLISISYHMWILKLAHTLKCFVFCLNFIVLCFLIDYIHTRSDTRGTLPDIAANARPLRAWFCHTSVYRFTRAKTFAVTRQIRHTFACVSCYCATFRLHFNHARRGRALAAISGKVPSVSGVWFTLTKWCDSSPCFTWWKTCFWLGSAAPGTPKDSFLCTCCLEKVWEKDKINVSKCYAFFSFVFVAVIILYI